MPLLLGIVVLGLVAWRLVIWIERAEARRARRRAEGDT